MEDFPTKIADSLEAIALKIRSLTVDRVRGAAKWIALGLVIASLAFLAVILLLVGVFRLLGELIGVRTTYAAIGGLFVVAGAFLWSMRIPRKPKEASQDD